MSDTLVFTHRYNMWLICWLAETGLLENGSDLMFLSESPDFLSRVEKTGKFGNTFQTMAATAGGVSLAMSERLVREVLENPGKVFRNKIKYWDLLNPGLFFRGAPTNYKRYLVPDPFFLESMPGVYHHLLKDRDFPFHVWEHATVLAPITLNKYFSTHYTSANGLLMGLNGVRAPSWNVKGMYLSRPEVVKETQDSGMPIRRVPSIDVDNLEYKETVNFLLDYSPADDAPYRNSTCIVFPSVSDIDERRQRERRALLAAIGRIVTKDAMIIKPHPRTAESELREFDGYEVFSTRQTPFELTLLNTPEISEKLIVGYYVTSAMLTPKIFFDMEPHVLLLEKLFMSFDGFGDYQRRIALAERVKQIYRSPDRFLIAESADEAMEFVKNYKAETSRQPL